MNGGKMDRTDLHPEIADTIARLPRLPFASRTFLPLARMVYDLASRSKVMDGVEVRSITAGNIDMLAFSNPAKPSRAGVLWIYGGGYLAGKPEHLNSLTSRIALQTGATIFVPKYRLAPKHPFPAALEDCQSAWKWMIENANTFGIEKDQLAIGGNSAGGGLAASLVHWISDQRGVQPRSQILFYPMLDDRTAANQDLDTIGHFIWDNKTNRAAWGAYLSPNAAGADELPDYAVPARRRDLRGLPKTWIGQCMLDLFAAENADYAKRLNDAGVKCEVEQVDAVPHAFEAICPDSIISEAFVTSAIEFLQDTLGGTHD